MILRRAFWICGDVAWVEMTEALKREGWGEEAQLDKWAESRWFHMSEHLIHDSMTCGAASSLAFAIASPADALQRAAVSLICNQIWESRVRCWLADKKM